MTTPDQPAGRPVPDTDDLRLLAEIINNGSIGLPQAAWNARMSQAEAADRFVTMAERGMPLRLVAEGDREMLWRIAQAGPATGGVPLPAAVPEPAPAQAPPAPPSVPVQVESQPVQQIPVPDIPPPPRMAPPVPAPPVTLPPASAVPPHEQAIAGAVPLGQPPFGTPPVDPPPPEAPPSAPPAPEAPPVAEAPLAEPAPPAEPAAPEPAAPEPPVVESPVADSSTWGVPGVATWARSDEPATASALSAPASQAAQAAPVVTPLPPLTPPPPPPPPPAEPAPAASSPTRRVMISGQPTQTITGLFGEQLNVSLQQIVDPADQILTQAGYRLDPAERALLVQTTVGNQGPVDYESLPDLYLVLVSSTGAILQKAAMAVAQFPAHRVGVPAGAHASGWTVFLVPAATEVAEVRWSVRPDLVHRTVSWGFGPA